MVLVQRLADGDWSFPKGRLQPGGIVAQAVLGEVEEETGLWCRWGLQVGPSADRDLRRLLEGWRPAVGEVSSC